MKHLHTQPWEEHDAVLQLEGWAKCMTSTEKSKFSNKQGDWKTSLKYQASEDDSKVRGDKSLTQGPGCEKEKKKKGRPLGKKQVGQFL